MRHEDEISLNADDSLSSNAESVLSEPNMNSVDYQEKLIKLCYNSSNSVDMISSEPNTIVGPTAENRRGNSAVTTMSSAADGKILNISFEKK